MTTNQQQPQSADDFLMGGGVPSAKFPTIGTTITGQITQPPTVEQQRDYTTGDLKFWDDGNPQMQMVVTLATAERDPANADDDGTRRVYVKGQLKQAVAQAVRASGARGLEVGGTLTVTYARDGERKNPRFNAPKEYVAQYLPAAATHLQTSAAASASASASASAPAPAPAPQQAAAPTAATDQPPF